MGRYTKIVSALQATLGATYFALRLAAFFGLGVGLSSAIAATLVSHSFWSIVGAAVGISISLASIGFLVVLRSEATNRRIQAPNPDLRILAFSCTYYVRPNNEYELVQEITAQAKRSGVDRYSSGIRWTGSVPYEVTVDQTGYRVEERGLDKDGFFEEQKIIFERKLNRGERRTFSIRFVMRDVDGVALPYLTKTIFDDYSSTLRQRVCLPKIPKRYWKQIYQSAHDQIPSKDEINERPDTTEIVQMITKPIYGQKHMIRWEL